MPEYNLSAESSAAGGAPGDAMLAVDQNTARAKAYAIEGAMLGLPQAEIPVRHYFAPGLYAREMTMPPDCTLVGKLHKRELMHTISKGDVLVLTDAGVVRITAPHTFVSAPGAKRVFYSFAETVWTVYHPTDETDLERIEDQFIAKSEAEYLAFAGMVELQ